MQCYMLTISQFKKKKKELILQVPPDLPSLMNSKKERRARIKDDSGPRAHYQMSPQVY